MKISDKMIDTMGEIANKISGNIYLLAIREAFVVNMPLIITGSFATLFSSVLCSTSSGLARLEGFEFLANFTTLFSSVSYACINLLALFICYLVGSSLGRAKGLNDKFAGLLAIASYVITTPTQTTIEVDGVAQVVNNVLVNTNTNAQGLFTSILIAILSISLFSMFMKNKKLVLKMPSSVPASIAESFSALIPTILTIFSISLVAFVFKAISGLYISEAVFKLLQAPLVGVMQHPAGILVIILVTQVFWFFGLHGANITSAIREPLMLAALATNADLVANGLQPTMNVARPFWSMYCTIGGSGCTWGLLIAIYFFSKREDYRVIAKLSTVPAIFTINEPLIFGLPLVLNPILMVPFILTPLVSASIGYASTALGFAGRAFVEVPWTTPVFLNAFLATGGSIGAVITQAVCLAVSILIYIPFVKIANKKEFL